MDTLLTPTTPGIAIRKLQTGVPEASIDQLLPDDPYGRLSRYSIYLPNWLEAAVSTRLDKERAIHQEGGITVLFDGYLTDIVYNSTNKFDIHFPALAVLNLYQELQSSAFLALRGSFVILLLDEATKTALLVTDRKSSRPLFYRQLNNKFYTAAPTVTALANFPPNLSDLQPSKLVEFMISATFRGNSTLYPEVTKLPNGSILRIDDNTTAVEHYWKMQFAVADRSVEYLLNECDSLLNQSVQRLLDMPERKFLFLSGGIDSRVILGYLRRHIGSDINVAYYWSELTKGDDATVARHIADTYKLNTHEYEISLNDFVSSAPAATAQADCRSEVIDSAPLYRFSQSLSQDYGAYINGDECFGWHRNINTTQEALNEIGWFGLDQVGRLKSWLNPQIAKQIENEIQIHLESIVSQANERNPDNLKDKLYYDERLGNMLNGFTWAKLHYYESFRPLIDEDVIDFVCTIPNEWRGDKQLLHRLLNEQFPDIAAMPTSTKDVLPTAEIFRNFIHSNDETRDFIKDQLTSKLDPRLASIFSTSQFKDSISALLNGTSLPSIHQGWKSHVPGLWRFTKPPENRVDPFTLALRLVQLNLHLSSN